MTADLNRRELPPQGRGELESFIVSQYVGADVAFDVHWFQRHPWLLRLGFRCCEAQRRSVPRGGRMSTPFKTAY